MTRSEALSWWRLGYEAGFRAGARDRVDRGAAEHASAIAEFRTARQADQQAGVDALILETVHVLAGALLGQPGIAESDAA